jgi:2-methylcitrate dehydratase PrpD
VHHYRKGWHPTATLGVFGAAAASARLLNLNVEQTATTLAIAASLSSGIKAQFRHHDQTAARGTLQPQWAFTPR